MIRAEQNYPFWFLSLQVFKKSGQQKTRQQVMGNNSAGNIFWCSFVVLSCLARSFKKNLLIVKGSVAGAKGSYVIIEK